MTARTRLAFYPSTLVASYTKDIIKWHLVVIEDRAKTLSPVEHGDRHGSPGKQTKEGRSADMSPRGPSSKGFLARMSLDP